MMRYIIELPEPEPEADYELAIALRRQMLVNMLMASTDVAVKRFQVMYDDRPRGMQYQCPDCPWVEYQNRYGWDRHNARAVEVHQQHLCPKVKEKEGRASVSE